MVFVTSFFLFFPLLFGSEGIIERYQAPDTIEDIGLGNEGALKRGKQKLKEYESRSSPCWIRAMRDLQSKCSESTDLERSILAVRFANCHFQNSGLKTYDCTDEVTFKECTRLMKADDAASFIIYSEFFTHVTDVCFYLQSDVWRQKTAETIIKLSKTAYSTIDKLDQSLQNQDLVLSSQEKTLWNQRLIMKREENLKKTLDASTKSATAAFDEMKRKATQQEALFTQAFENIFEGLRQITALQEMFLGEFLDLKTFAFYTVSIITCYLFTNCPRTTAARIWLFLLSALLVLVERWIVYKALSDKERDNSTTEWYRSCIWLARKVFIAVALFIFGYFFLTYKDQGKINHKILKEVERKLAILYDMHATNKGIMVVDGKENRPSENKGKGMLPVDPPHSNAPMSYEPSPASYFSDISDEDIAKTKDNETKKLSKKNFVSGTKYKGADADHFRDKTSSHYNLRKSSPSRLKSLNDSKSSIRCTPKIRKKVNKKLPVRKEKECIKSAGMFSSDDEF